MKIMATDQVVYKCAGISAYTQQYINVYVNPVKANISITIKEVWIYSYSTTGQQLDWNSNYNEA